MNRPTTETEVLILTPGQSVVDYMAQPSGNHEPSDAEQPTVPLVSRETFWIDYARRWGAVVEPDSQMGRVYVELPDGRIFATEMDAA